MHIHDGSLPAIIVRGCLALGLQPRSNKLARAHAHVEGYLEKLPSGPCPLFHNVPLP